MLSMLRHFFGTLARSGTRVSAQAPPVRKLQCEALEDRTLLSVTGTEFLVNTTKPLKQIEAASASSSNGRTVVVWREVKNQYDSDIKGQLYDPTGHKVGSEFVVADGLDRQRSPSVAMDAVGNFVVTWTIDYSETDQDIIAARFNANGVKQGKEFKVAWSYKSEFGSTVAMASNGDFDIAYHYQFGSKDTDIYVQQFKANGTLVRTIQVAVTAGNETQATIAAAPDGRFAVAYTKSNDVFLRRYSKDGALLGASTIANTTLEETNPAVAMDKYGNALVVYQARVAGSANYDIKSRFVSSSGVLGTIYDVAHSSAAEHDPAVAVDPTTNRIVTAFQVGTTTSSTVVVAELSTKGAVTYSSTVGAAGLSLPSVSVGASKRYLVVGQTLTSQLGDSDGGIAGRWGQLT